MWRSKKKTEEDEDKAGEKDSAAAKEELADTALADDKAAESRPSSFMKSLFKRKSVGGSEQADEDSKVASETREQSETGENPDQVAEPAEAAEEAKHSFMHSLFKRKSHKTEQEEGDSKREQSERSEHQENSSDGDSTAAEEEAPYKSLWPNLWLGKKPAEAETGGEAVQGVEVEINADSTFQVHDNYRDASVRRYPIDPNRPSVHEEALEMLTGSLLIYIFADLRKLAREGVIDSKGIDQDPIAVRQVMEAIREHKEALEKYAINHDDLNQRLTMLKNMHEQAKLTAEANGDASTLIGKMLQEGPQAAIAALKAQEELPDVKESVLSQFNEVENTQGVVYGIAVNHLHKRVTIIFRGSVTQQDFITDARSAQKKVESPVHALVEEAPQRIGIHTGFYTYLFAKDDIDENKLRCQRILDDAKELLKENPGYRLYLTGHSLGGALSALCGFYAANDDELIEHGPVVVISIASPQVGNKKFCDSFHVLEKLGRLQHLRVANKEDMITHLPFVHIKAHVLSPVAVAMFGAGNLYQHCGIHLELKGVEEEENEARSQARLSLHHGTSHNSLRQYTVNEKFTRAIDSAKMLAEAVVPLGKGDIEALTGFHSCEEYEARLMASRDYLSSVTLDALYQDEGIVGAELAKHLSHELLPPAEAN